MFLNLGCNNGYQQHQSNLTNLKFYFFFIGNLVVLQTKLGSFALYVKNTSKI